MADEITRSFSHSAEQIAEMLTLIPSAFAKRAIGTGLEVATLRKML
jgi:hypothetical protein